jgi:hypothetical protein
LTTEATEATVVHRGGLESDRACRNRGLPWLPWSNGSYSCHREAMKRSVRRYPSNQLLVPLQLQFFMPFMSFMSFMLFLSSLLESR